MRDGNIATNMGILAHSRPRGRVVSSAILRLTGDSPMLTLGLFARLEAKPGKEEDVAAFLMQGLQLANQETTTPLWFAVRLAPTTFAIFDAFHDEAGRQAHLTGPIAKALMARAPDLLASPPVIERLDVLGVKLPS
jgi:quinol monooxygenase YgiN